MVGRSIAARYGYLLVALVACEKGPKPTPTPPPAPVVPSDAAIDAVDCHREEIERSIAEHRAKKLAVLPRLYGKTRATPGETLDDTTLRDLGMDRQRTYDDHPGLHVAFFDATYPGTCDPAGPCDCIGSGDEREICSSLYDQLVKAWGKPNQGPRGGMFSFESRYDDAIWKANGRTAVLTADCALVFY